MPRLLLPLALLIASASAAAAGSIRFFGYGVAAPTFDRATVALDAPARPADLGASDFTIEFWLRALPGDNGSTTACHPSADAWIVGNILLDRDIWGPGDFGDFGLSLMDGKIAFGVHNGSAGATICGATAVDDGLWHHLAVTRRRFAGSGRPAGEIRLFLDGSEDAPALDGPDGDLSYRDGRSGSTWDPFLVLGAEKHDAGAEYPSYRGWLDELRLSISLRYAGSFTPAARPFASDGATAALFSFDEGAGGQARDRSGAVGGPSHAQVRIGGGPPPGPEWSSDSPFLPFLFGDGLESGSLAAWSAASGGA